MSDLTTVSVAELRACLLPNITGEPYHGDISPKLSALDELARRAEANERLCNAARDVWHSRCTTTDSSGRTFSYDVGRTELETLRHVLSALPPERGNFESHPDKPEVPKTLADARGPYRAPASFGGYYARCTCEEANEINARWMATDEWAEYRRWEIRALIIDAVNTEDMIAAQRRCYATAREIAQQVLGTEETR